MNVIAREAFRQQKETFEQLKRQHRQWFVLRLVLGYCSIVLLSAVLVICAAILFQFSKYPEFVVKAASIALFADLAGLVAAVWKFALNPGLENRLSPVTRMAASDTTWTKTDGP